MCLDLTSVFDSMGTSPGEARERGGFTVGGASYPSASFPEGGLRVREVPFILADTDGRRPNVVTFLGQTIPVPTGVYGVIHVLGASENGDFFDYVGIAGAGGERVQRFRIDLSDWIRATPSFGNEPAIVCPVLHTRGGVAPMAVTVWYAHAGIPGDLVVSELILPDNPCMHAFSLTLERAGKGGGR